MSRNDDSIKSSEGFAKKIFPRSSMDEIIIDGENIYQSNQSTVTIFSLDNVLDGVCFPSDSGIFYS